MEGSSEGILINEQKERIEKQVFLRRTKRILGEEPPIVVEDSMSTNYYEEVMEEKVLMVSNKKEPKKVVQVQVHANEVKKKEANDKYVDEMEER